MVGALSCGHPPRASGRSHPPRPLLTALLTTLTPPPTHSLPSKWYGVTMVVTGAVAVDTSNDYAQSLVSGKRAEDYTATQERLRMIIADSRRRFQTQASGAGGAAAGAGGQGRGAAATTAEPQASSPLAEGGGPEAGGARSAGESGSAGQQ